MRSGSFPWMHFLKMDNQVITIFLPFPLSSFGLNSWKT
uniref:Uncharacterized protein n=1 Tax=Lepeophtheirus salmonis TaxID=72036 RepID=A0A0K2T511_LEPSM